MSALPLPAEARPIPRYVLRLTGGDVPKALEICERVREMIERAGLKRLADGSWGYFVRAPREDDCFAAAVATVLQVPIDDVPDPRIDERLAAGETPEEIDQSAQDEFEKWLRRRGLRMVAHRKLPVARRRWIGVVEQPGDFKSHCIVMSHERFLFDPLHYVEHLFGQPERPPQMRQFQPRDVTLGLSFQRVRRRNSNKPKHRTEDPSWA